MDGEGRVVDGGEAGGESGPPGVVAVFVPPAILQEVQAIFHTPMVADVPQQVCSGHAVGIQAGHEIPHIVRQNFAVGGADLPIHAER